MTRTTIPDVAAMHLALAEAAKAGAAGDIPIGAIVLGPQGDVLAAAGNARERAGDPTAHAEILALRSAAAVLGDWRLAGCTLVVTLEPCPMCAGAVVMSRVARLVFGAWNDEYGAAGSAWDLVRDRRLNHRPEVVGGVLEQECGRLVQDYMGLRRTGVRR
jgi:tRNA(adenine34) deaminase